MRSESELMDLRMAAGRVCEALAAEQKARMWCVALGFMLNEEVSEVKSAMFDDTVLDAVRSLRDRERELSAARAVYNRLARADG